ncbi:MAG: hypothetical protein HC874_22055 [Richelia sp. SL_2_1]|nr:hypothetical protein [Richelia sp. SM1_7_0]NJO29907.1 hypothetical protein [Richelia sp. SL_2_1]
MFNAWTATMPNMQGMNFSNYSENFEKILQLQEELSKNSLEFQEQASRWTIETQRKTWNNYFHIFRK